MTYRCQRILFPLLVLFLVGFSWLGGFAPTTEAAVGLLYFQIDPAGAGATEINLKWATETETDTAGFVIKRSATGIVQDATIVADVPSTGSASTGDTYEFTDSDLTTGSTYTYWLYELTSTGGETLLGGPVSAKAGATGTETSTPMPTATSIATQQLPANTPTETSVVKTPTNTPTATRVVGPSATPTFTAQATATFTVQPQAIDTPNGDAPTQQPTNTSVPVAQGQATNTSVPIAQGQATNTPVVSVTTPIVKGATPNPDLLTPEVKAGATVGAIVEERAASTDQTLQVPSTPTQVLDAAAASGTTSDVTPMPETTNSTPQAVAEEAASGSAPSTERLARPTATPRPTATAELGSGSGSLLLILGGASLFGAVVLALAALVIWRRR